MAAESTWSGKQKAGLALLFLAIIVGIALFFYYSVWLVVIGILFFIAGFLLLSSKNQGTLKRLLEEKRKIGEQISNAEKKFLSREIPEKAFKEFTYKKQGELIELESKVEALQKKGTINQSDELQKIASKKKHLLKQLLIQKQSLLSEFRISEQKYLKRELGEKEFFKIQHSIQSRLLELDSEIKSFYSSENIGGIMGELGSSLKTAEKEAREKKQSELDEMAFELSDQVKHRKKN